MRICVGTPTPARSSRERQAGGAWRASATRPPASGGIERVTRRARSRARSWRPSCASAWQPPAAVVEMQPAGAGTAASAPVACIAVQREDRAVAGRPHRQARAVGPERERVRAPSAAAPRRSPRCPGRCTRPCRRAVPAAPVASRCRSETALPGRGDVDVAPAGGDRDRRRLCQRAAGRAARGRRRGGCSRSARAAARARRWSHRAAARQRRWRPWTAAYSVAPSGEIASASTPAQRATGEARAGVGAAAHAGLAAAELQQRAAGRRRARTTRRRRPPARPRTGCGRRGRSRARSRRAGRRPRRSHRRRRAARSRPRRAAASARRS